MSSIEKPQAPRPAPPADTVRPEAGATAERVLAGRYRLFAQLARGGMGTVWKASDLVLDREVAVKELRLPEDLSEAERTSLHDRTTREARVAAKLNHPNVVTVLDVVNEDQRPWIVMELVSARTLTEVIGLAGLLPYQRVAEIGLQLLSALNAAHAEGIIHRDVKPENVMLSEDGRVVLTDFGLAAWSGESALTSSGRILGSPAYISPERAQAGPVGPASDLWSLGATLYTAVEGYPPYDRKGYISILRGDELDDPAPAANAGALGPVLAGLLKVRPDDRLTGENASKMLRIAALAPSAPSPEPKADTAASDSDASVDDQDSARDHFKAGATVLGNSLQGSISDSVSSIQSALHKGAHAHSAESVTNLLASVRDSTNSLGLTNAGRHRNKRPAAIAAAVGAGVLILLAVVLWALLSR